MFSQVVGNRSLALRAEYRIKQLSKAEKERLVAGKVALEDLLTSLQGETR